MNAAGGARRVVPPPLNESVDRSLPGALLALVTPENIASRRSSEEFRACTNGSGATAQIPATPKIDPLSSQPKDRRHFRFAAGRRRLQIHEARADPRNLD
jgi:hypothetical protein